MFMYTVTVHWMRDGEDHLLTHLFKNKKDAMDCFKQEIVEAEQDLIEDFHIVERDEMSYIKYYDGDYVNNHDVIIVTEFNMEDVK